MRLLVTGMSGLVGGIVGRALAARHDVRALNRRIVPGFPTHRADVRDAAALAPAFTGVDVVIHAAGYQGDDWDEALTINVHGTRNVLEAARAAGVPRVVFVSSGAVQAGLEQDDAIRRLIDQPHAPPPVSRPALGPADPTAPESHYGVTKLAAEALCRMYALTHGMTVVVARLGRVLATNRPDTARAAAVYLSHADLVQLLGRCIARPLAERLTIVNGLSNNARAFRDLSGARALLGYAPRDGVPQWPLPDSWTPAPVPDLRPATTSAPTAARTERSRVLVVLTRYPQRSETYIATELDAVHDRYDLRIVALGKANRPYAEALPFTMAEARPEDDDPRRRRFAAAEAGDGPTDWFPNDTIARYGAHLLEIARTFRPHVIHTHYLHNAALAAYLADALGIGFTVRTHSYELMHTRYRLAHGGHLEPSANARRMAQFTVGASCRGIVTFPYTVPALEAAGIPAVKLIPCHPVLNLARFEGHRAAGTDVIGGGPALLKKGMRRFIDLARLVPERPFDLYAIGHDIAALRAYASASGSPVQIHDDVPHAAMPAIYAQHGWLVYTADPHEGNCGWPMTILEAQAVGLGVIAPNIHPGSAEQLGGGGYLYTCISEIPDLLATPYPDDLRERGFANVHHADVRRHIHLLTDLWDR